MDQSVLTSKDIIGLIDNGIEAAKDAGWPYLVGLEVGSNQETEKYRLLGNSPALREWIAGRSVKSLRTAGIDVTNKPFEATIILSRPDMRRDKTGFINMRIAQLVDRYVQHWAKLLSILREAGHTTVCFDAQYFYDNDHSWGDSGTLKNYLTANEYNNLNVTTPAAPTAIELAKAILDVIQHFYTFKDDQGEPANEGAARFLVHVPSNMFAALIQALSSNFLSTGTGAIDNPVLVGKKYFEVIPSVNPRLTDNDVFYVDRIDGAAKPFILQSEPVNGNAEYELTQKAEGSDFEHDNNAHEYGINCSRNVGFGFWTSSIMAQLS
jgi:phage major head subunit gpT-like protein